MLVVRQTLGVDGARLAFDCAIGPRAGLYSVSLVGATWDTRFVPEAPCDRSAWSLIALVVRGRAWLDPGRIELEPGSGVVLGEQHVLPNGRSPVVVRSGADRCEAVALRVPTSWLAVAAEQPLRRRLGARLSGELTSFADVMRRGSVVNDLEQRVSAAVQAAADDHLLTAATCAGVAGAVLPPELRRASAAVFPSLGKLSQNPMLVDLVERACVTPRQILRDILRLQSEYDFPDRGWREFVTRWRVTLAVLLLSANDMTPRRAASETGYGSVTAMGRAFRRHGLPSPREVRRRIHDGSPSVSLACP